MSLLRLGDTVAVVAPASLATVARLEAGLEALAALGFVPSLRLPEPWTARPYLAGTDAARAAVLHEAFADPAVAAIWCLRGGFGSARLLPALVARSLETKPLIGFSDITALHLGLLGRGPIGLHGPVVTQLPDLDEGSLHHLRQLLTGAVTQVPLGDAVDVLRPGTAEGPLVGGNLAVLASLVGTPWLPSLRGALLFLEDVGEAPYRLDRLLWQLRAAGALDGVGAVLLGEFRDVPGGTDAGFDALCAELAGYIAGPVLAGLPFGHGRRNVALPVGVHARVTTEPPSLTLLEAP